MSDIHNEIGYDCIKNTEIVQQYSENLEEKKNVQATISQYNVSDMSEVSDVSEALDFMLWHLQEPLWPRNVSTAATQDRQKPVFDRDRAILFYQGALRQDCKLAIYSNYGELAKNDPNTPAAPKKPKPCHIFIDLDLKDFGGDRDKLELALGKTLRNIKRKLNGAVPTVLWSGGGYHVHQPLDANAIPIFEDLPEFKRHKDPSVQFMRYAEQVLTSGKADHDHRVSFNSCMARLPATRNCKYEGEAAEVKIVQVWNGIRARPSQQFMFTDFLIYLVQADFDVREKLREMTKFNATKTHPMTSGGSIGIAWIDRLLQTAIPDWRKTAVALVLAPYLLTIRRMSYDQAYHTVMQWAARCAQLSSLRPTERGFIDRVHTSLERALNKQSKPLRWATLVSNYSQMHEVITTTKQATQHL